MTRALRTSLLALLCAAATPLAVAVPAPASAQGRPAAGPATLPQDSSSANEAKTKEQLEAQQHFQRAKDLYQTGSYREAIAELEAARLLDPKAKDLVFNLGIVHEKLARYDEAITFFRQYMEMESVSAPERGKAENIIKRIEGAKREVPVAPAGSSTVAVGDPPPAPPAEEAVAYGRIDTATMAAASAAVVGLGVGAIFGIMAVSNRPSAGEFVSGRDGSFATLQTRTDNAHAQAIVSDVGFGVGIIAAAVTAYLYFGRPKDAKPAVQPAVAPLASGGVLLLGGSFR